jgi:pyrimidine-nucleoside phosphorylase
MFHAVDVILKKRDGQELTNEEIITFIQKFTAGDIPDYQAAALAMAIYFRGMTRREIVVLTRAMAESGQMLDLSDITDYAVDKHSSGGVGDKTTLVVLPLVAACGVPVAKMSGRGLGFSGGTLDKLEAIRGYRVALSEAEFRQQAREIGIVLCGQTGELAPADGKLYALRDVTGTIESIPLIAASIMSKKLAAGAKGIVLDVKYGSGAFMKTLDQAHELAQVMVQIGTDDGRDMIALLSNMNQPLGCMVGNALEVREAVETLRGGGPQDLRQHCVETAAYMLALAGRGRRWTDHGENCALIEAKLADGSGLVAFRRLVQAQGGDVAVIDDLDLLPRAAHQVEVQAEGQGYASFVDAVLVAKAALVLGAGREKKGDPIDPAVGVEVAVKVGDEVKAGQRLAVIHANNSALVDEARALIQQAVSFSPQPVDPMPLFAGVIDGRTL